MSEGRDGEVRKELGWLSEESVDGMIKASEIRIRRARHSGRGLAVLEPAIVDVESRETPPSFGSWLKAETQSKTRDSHSPPVAPLPPPSHSSSIRHCDPVFLAILLNCLPCAFCRNGQAY